MLYPERVPRSEAAADRLLAMLGMRLHQLLGRRLARSRGFAEAVSYRAAALGTVDPAALVPQLRYRLRRDGFTTELLIECFALCAIAKHTSIPAPACAAARCLVQGGLVELANPGERLLAIGMAAFARAAYGDCVHVLAPSEAMATTLAHALGSWLPRLGMRVGCIEARMDGAARRAAYACPVLCAVQRVVGLDYLRDGLQAGGRPGNVRMTLARLAGDASANARPMLPGLPCALVADADVVMLDDAQAPLTIATQADSARERLIYEQAIELARALTPGKDFTQDAEGLQLSAPAAQLVARLVAPMGGLWTLRERREGLVLRALEVLHGLQAGMDYEVRDGQIVLPQRAVKPGDEAGDEELMRLLEIKEGCCLGTRREVVARMSVTRFLRRYVHLAGICTDARGIERELWDSYTLKTTLAGARGSRPGANVRLFASAEAKRAALLRALTAAVEAGRHVVLALRNARGVAEIEALLADLPARERIAITVFPARATPPAGSGASVIVADLHEADRLVAQLCLDAGAASCEVLLSVQDEAVRARLGPFALLVARIMANRQGEIRLVGGLLAGLARRRAERAQRMARLELAARDRMLDDLLAVSGRGE